MQISIQEPAIIAPVEVFEQRTLPEPRRTQRRDRRKNRQDRRRAERDGVIVTLSTRPERRGGGDRRRVQP